MSPQHLYILLSGPRPGISNSQPRFTAWLHLRTSMPSTSSSHLKLLYSSCKVADHRWGLTLACTTWKPQSLCTQSTATDHVRTQPPCPCMANLPWRVEVGGQCHSQYLKLTGLGKSLPLTCQQQSKLNYKRRVHPTHMKEPFQVPSLAVPLDLRGHLLH